MTVSVLAMLQMPEIIGLLILALILFGAKKLPELARGLGHGIKEFKKATRDVTDELQSAMDLDRPSSPPRSPQYPSYPDPAGTQSNESNPGYVSESAPGEAGQIGSPEESPAPEPQLLSPGDGEADAAKPIEPADDSVTSRVGKSE
jgi:sec-independent protein translocase protein TatA